jgi:hypothetical protein
MRLLFLMVGFAAVVVAVQGPVLPEAPGQEPPECPRVEIPAAAATLEGTPTVRIDSDQGTTTRTVLDTAEAARSRLIISRIDDQFYWTSRENRPLRLESSEAFTYFVSEPGKYIRITRMNDRISYVEHVDLASGDVTWWGELKIVLGDD